MEIKNLLAALVKAQLAIKAPEKDKVNPQFKSKYSSLDSIYGSCREELAKQGLVLSHSVEYDAPSNRYFLKTTLYHVSGESISNTFPMFVDKQTSQGLASARTYACRYAIAGLLALPSDDDDDGEGAARREMSPQKTIPLPAPKFLSKEQSDTIIELLNENEELMNRILSSYKVSSLTEIEGKHFDSIVKRLQAMKEQVKE